MKTKITLILAALAAVSHAQLPSAMTPLTGADFSLTADQIMVRDVSVPTYKLMTGTEFRIGLLGSAGATFFGTPTSANLAAVVSDENGTGKLIFSAGTLAVASGKTLTVSNSVTLAGTDGTTITLPTVSATLLHSGGAGDGSALTSLNGANISSGSIAVARIATALTTPGPIGGTTPGSGAFTSFTANNGGVVSGAPLSATAQPALGSMTSNQVMTKSLGDEAYDSMNTIRSVQVGSLTWGGVTENVGLLPCFTNRPDLNFTFSWGTSPPRGHFLPYYLTAQKTITSATIKIISGTHATYVLRGAIYASDANGFPAGRLGSAWTWSCASTGMVTATVGSIVCPKGLIWVCVQPSEGNTAWGGNLVILGQANTNNALLSNILGTRVSGWDTYMHGIQPEAYGMSSLGSDASTMGTRSFVSANDYFPTVFLK